MTIAPLDLLVLIGYFAAMLGIGWWTGRGHHTSESYFLGNRGFSGVILGISLIGSVISSVTFIAGPADSFKTAWLRILTNLAVPFAAVFVACTFVPFFRQRNITSAYAYLEQRFSVSLSMYAASIFLVTQLIRVSTVGYLLCILLQALTGISFEWCLLITGGVTAVYTVKGGFSAVVWTDVIQTVILVLGSLVAIGVIVGEVPGGLATIVRDAFAAHKLSFWDLNRATGQLEPTPWGFSLTNKTVVMLFVAGLVGFMSANLDQANVQRWASARSTRDAARAVIVLGIGAVPIWAAFKFLGTSLYVFFQYHPSEVSSAILAGQRKAEEIVPHFITAHLQPGLAGLVIAGALAAAMSTLSACINAASMVWVRDFHARLAGTNRTDAGDLRIGKLAAWAASLIMIGGAWLIHRADAKTLTDLILMLSPIVGGTVPGIFLVGLFTRRANARGTWVGLGVTWVVIVYVLLSQWRVVPGQFALPVDLYYIGVVGNLLTIVVALFASRLDPRPRTHDWDSLTVWSAKSERQV